jgi:hypothetical protein
MWRILRAIHDAGPMAVASASPAAARALIEAQLLEQKTAMGAQGPLKFTSTGDATGPAGVVEISDDKGGVKSVPVPTVASLLGKKKER